MPAKPDPKKILDEAMQLEPSARAFVARTHKSKQCRVWVSPKGVTHRLNEKD